jgi:hypothetical protein
VLTKSSRVEELHQRLADHYRLDLSSPPSASAPVGLPTHDMEIQRRQWTHLEELGEVWKEALDSFQLCKKQGEYGCNQCSGA